MHYWIGEGMPLICVIIALIIGRHALSPDKKALFPKLVAAGLGCMALSCLHNMVYYMVLGTYANGIYISFFGMIGCYLFLVSANYGQLDSIFDDRSKKYLKYRIIALLGPVVLNIGFIPTLLTDRLTIGMKVFGYLGWLPIIVASYYNFKHAILPDGGFAFVKAVRPYNIAALVLEVSQIIYLTTRTLNLEWGISVSSVVLGLSLIAVMHFAKKGAMEWTI